MQNADHGIDRSGLAAARKRRFALVPERVTSPGRAFESPAHLAHFPPDFPAFNGVACRSVPLAEPVSNNSSFRRPDQSGDSGKSGRNCSACQNTAVDVTGAGYIASQIAFGGADRARDGHLLGPGCRWDEWHLVVRFGINSRV